MKKTILFSCIVMAALVACYKDDVVLKDDTKGKDPSQAKPYLSGDENVKMKRHKITTERALSIAQEAKGLFANENERMIKTRSIGTILAPVAVTTHSKTRAVGGVDTLMFVVNYSNNDGFVFVSNDDRDGEILMYSGGGNFAMQDTAGNPGLKLHVEMLIAYQEYKLNEMRVAEANGQEYMGGMTTDEIGIDECLPNIISSTRGVVPGPPGVPHTCNVTGQMGLPGLPGAPRQDICAPATYVEKNWYGDVDAIDLAQNKYRNQKCFGVPVSPPNVKFTMLGAPGIGGSHQDCFPYCSPHIRNYDGYYNSYGAKMGMLLKTVTNNVANQYVAPLLTTCWDQSPPLNHGSNAAGCGPIAVAQLMIYHSMPKTYVSKAFGGTHRTEIDILRTLETNTDIYNSIYRLEAWQFLEEIRARLNVIYNSDGSTSTKPGKNGENMINLFNSFGFSVGDNRMWDYYKYSDFYRVSNSIKSRLPVHIRGGSNSGSGHQWILDGYQQTTSRYYYADYYFDEYGNFNGENKYSMFTNYTDYVHVNYGWGKSDLFWIMRGVYEFNGTNYDRYLYYLAGIKPQN